MLNEQQGVVRVPDRLDIALAVMEGKQVEIEVTNLGRLQLSVDAVERLEGPSYPESPVGWNLGGFTIYRGQKYRYHAYVQPEKNGDHFGLFKLTTMLSRVRVT